MWILIICLLQVVCGFGQSFESGDNSTSSISSQHSNDEFSHVTMSAIVIASIPSFVGFGVGFYLIRKAVMEANKKKLAESTNHSEEFEIELSDEISKNQTMGTAPPTKDSLYMKTFYEWMNTSTYSSLSTDASIPLHLDTIPCFPFEMTKKTQQPPVVYKYADIIKEDEDMIDIGIDSVDVRPALHLHTIGSPEIAYTLKV